MSQQVAIAHLLESFLSRKLKRVYFANAHTMVTATKDDALADILERSDLLLADGSGVLWGSKLLGTPLAYNLNGTDLVPALCRAGGTKGLSVYLLGAKPGVAESAAKKLEATCPGLNIAGVRDGYFSEEDLPNVLNAIKEANPHLLLVAMGVPLQEKWIDAHSDELPGIACMGVGGLFDFVAERVSRAPLWIRQSGLEWLWRLMMEPKRLWQRYTIGNLLYIKIVMTYALAQLKQQLMGQDIVGNS